MLNSTAKVPDVILGEARAHATAFTGNKLGPTKKFIEQTQYRCVYGPRTTSDKGVGCKREGTCHPDRGDGLKQGCKAWFIVKVLRQEPSTVEVHFLDAPHTGRRVYPELDRHVEGCPWVSKRARQVVLDHLAKDPLTQTSSLVGLVQQDSLRQAGLPPGPRLLGVEANRLEMDYPDLFRDYHITAKDISLQLRIDAAPADYFGHLSEGGRRTLLCWQTPRQLEILLKYGHKRAVFLDSTHGTNENRFELFSLMVLDDHHVTHTVSVAIAAQSTHGLIHHWLAGVVERAGPAWRPSCVFTDQSRPQYMAIRDAWNDRVPIALCHWHLLHDWDRHHRLCTGIDYPELRRALVRVRDLCLPWDPALARRAAEEALARVWRSHFPGQAFVDYFEQKWKTAYPMETWVAGFRTYNTSGQSSICCCEGWNATLKRRLGATHSTATGRRVDYLLQVLEDLCAEAHTKLQLNLRGKRHNKARKLAVRGACREARGVPRDAVVRLADEPGDVWTVRSQTGDPDLGHRVDASQMHGCSCLASTRGAVCEHSIAVWMSIDPALTETSIIRHLGSHYGSCMGTLEHMWAHAAEAERRGPPPEGSGAQTTMRKREAKAEAACTTPRRTCSTPATTCLSPMTPSPQVPSLLDTPSSSCAQPCRDVVADFPAFRQRVQGLLDRAERLEGGPHWATLTRAYRELEERLLAGAHAPVGLPPPVRGKGSGSKRTKYSPHKHAKRRLL
ncbi:hypothetical protein F751_0052 [Auxenochlorella protothecoides]|uniref:SWIM-type domain-containing protein n=1 Tax=Auxenochlorella protothecoides TaxID=3075 RepID=A0A087S9Z4_AUXPR|nr:hypothetical protein F751_0052 [Auxenochlorella protothecoides]KFM22548.1 hypothetical protein F751_0052 [Auxenochlorella protothecoides]